MDQQKDDAIESDRRQVMKRKEKGRDTELQKQKQKKHKRFCVQRVGNDDTRVPREGKDGG